MVNHQNTSTWIRCVSQQCRFSFKLFFFLFTVFFELFNCLSLILRDSADNSFLFFPLNFGREIGVRDGGVWGGVAKINPLAHAWRLTAMLNRQLCPLCWLTKILIQFEQHVPYVLPFWREFLAPRTRFPSAGRRFHSQEKLLAPDDRAIYNRFKTIFIGLDVQF